MRGSFATTVGLRLPLALMLLGLSACGDSGPATPGSIDLAVENPDRCDPLDARHCLLPFPSDTFTVADAATDTGRRISFALESMPVNASGVHIDPSEWNRNDGFSPGSQIATFVPGIDLEASGVARVTDISASLAPGAPIVLLDADSGERRATWAELDANASSDANRVLVIRPASNLREGHRYVVALRGLRTASGDAIAASDSFRAYRDRLRTNVPEMEARRARYEQVFSDLERAGIARGDLFLAWDFTVASTRSTTERLLHMRDDAFARLGDAAPHFTVERVVEGPDAEGLLARQVSGTFDVPLYLTDGGKPGSRMLFGMDGLPAASGTYPAAFTCNIPKAALAGPGGTATPARASVYGHGLLGSEDELNARNIPRMGNEHDFIFCGTRWLGMCVEDIENMARMLQDMSRFPTVADRLQQGVLNTLFLGRLMIRPDGLVSHPAFRDANGTPLLDRSELFYDGNSLGGILGGIATAVSIDWTRAVLGVSGMNFSVLLDRNVDFATIYRQIRDQAYPDEVERPLGILLLQMLWDRGEADGYANHLTVDPLPGTPAHTVLMHIAFGDWQVSQFAAETEARTIGAHLHVPALDPGRLPGYATPFFGIEPIDSYPYQGSAIVYWDSGTPAPPLDNRSPSAGRDPHEDPRADPVARQQKSDFLRTGGAVVDVCAGAPCRAAPAD